MYLKQLDILGIRNLKPMRLQFSPGINAFYGANGSGKTSVLEAIHVLGLGRSFRAANLQQVIHFEQPKYVVAGVIEGESETETTSIKVGTEKSKDSARAVFVRDGERCAVGSIAGLLPLLLLDTHSLELVYGGPAGRRDFIDLGMFHVEHSFLAVCQKFSRCLQQRNAELKIDMSLSQKKQQIAAWNEAFVVTGEAIDNARRDFLPGFEDAFNSLITGWRYYGKVSFQYNQGWPYGVGLGPALEDSLSLDLACGFTSRGPHRAELEIFVDGVPAKQVLSRGQQKVFVCAMMLAKAMLLKDRALVDSIFLVDDLSSELDKASFRLVFDKLVEIGGQIFITGIESADFLYSELKLFHVEQFGDVSLVDGQSY